MESLCFFTGLFRRFRSFVLGRQVEIVGQCRMCGNCCHDILLKDFPGGWLKKDRDFRTLCAREPEHERFEVTGKDDFGHLVFQCTLRGSDGLCTCYADRLPLCKNYPSKSIYYQGGWLGPECGFRFKSVTFRDVFLRRKPVRRRNFSQLLEQEIKRGSR